MARRKAADEEVAQSEKGVVETPAAQSDEVDTGTQDDADQVDVDDQSDAGAQDDADDQSDADAGGVDSISMDSDPRRFMSAAKAAEYTRKVREIQKAQRQD